MAYKILLIEDEPQLVDIYSSVFRKNGFVLDEVIKYGFQAKEKLQDIRQGQAERPDLILLDLILPDMNGIGILEEAKRYPETKDIPLFILTNYSDISLEKQSLSLGAEKFVLKTSYTPQELVDLVKGWFDEKSSQ